MSRWKVLSTKTLEPSLVDEISKAGIDIEEKEFISIKPIFNKKVAEALFQMVDQGITDITVTSTNAVEVLNRYMRMDDTYNVIPWKFHCLNGATKQAIIANTGLLGENIITTASNSAKLAHAIIENGVKELIFFCGNKRRDELPEILTDHGVVVHEIIGYETIETPIITTEHFDGILFFSPSAVKSFFSVNSIDKKIVCFAIGDTTAKAISDFSDNKIIVSDQPSQPMMLATVQSYFQHIKSF